MNKSIFTPDNIILLNLLKKMRFRLINDFLEYNTDIYKSMFEHENDSELTKLSIEKYFISWLESHFIYFEEYCKTENISEKNILELRNTISDLILKYLKYTDNSKSEYSNFSYQIITELKKELQNLINFGIQDNKNYNKLLFLIEKDKKLFDRQLKLMILEGE